MKRDDAVFVAGHTGLIGSAVVRKFEHLGYTNILTVAHGELDLCDPAAVRGYFDRARPLYVVLAAGRVGGIGPNQEYPADFIDENVTIQLNVLRAAHHAGVRKLILFGSSCMYPRDCPQPMPEDMLLAGRPEATSLPYAIAKLAGVYACLAYNSQCGEQKFIPLIPSSAYGPHDDFDPRSGHVLSALVARLHDAKTRHLTSVTVWGSGSPRREFVHVDDIAEACRHVLESDVSGLSLPLNLGVGEDIAIRELAMKIAAVVGYDGDIEWDLSKPDGAPRKLLDSSRLRASGWASRVTLADGLREVYDWYRNDHATIGSTDASRDPALVTGTLSTSSQESA
jgi:GDP-L-fucose synthase